MDTSGDVLADRNRGKMRAMDFYQFEMDVRTRKTVLLLTAKVGHFSNCINIWVRSAVETPFSTHPIKEQSML